VIVSPVVSAGVGKVTVPFLSTRPLTDVRFLFLLLPLWWLLGLEQFVWMPILAWSSIKVLLLNRVVKYNLTILLFAAFIILSIASAASVEEPFRYVSFARNLSSYLTALLLLFVITNSVTTWDEFLLIVRSVVIAMTLVAMLGLLSLTGMFEPKVTTPVGLALPEVVSATDLGNRLVVREFSSKAWFAYLGSYSRLRGTFLFATMYAVALALVIPLALLCVRYSRGLPRFGYTAAALILSINLVFTTGRMAIAALTAGAVVSLITNRDIPRAIRMWSTAAACLVLLFSLVLGGSILDARVSSFLEARGSSTADRLRIYELTLQGFLERPFIGWGTERDVRGLPYPAGSHSYFLGILYRHGLPSFILYVALWLSIWHTALCRTRHRHDAAAHYLRWSLLIATFVSLTEVIDLDVVALMTLWLVIACVHTIPAVRDGPSLPDGRREVQPPHY
jgi:O-antigen ligase